MNELGPGNHLPPVRDHVRYVSGPIKAGFRSAGKSNSSALIGCRTHDAGAADRAAALYAKMVLQQERPRVRHTEGKPKVWLQPIPAEPNGKQVVTRRRPKGVQCKNISDAQMITTVDRICHMGYPASTSEVAGWFLRIPLKVVAAKLARLKRRGLLTGCPCGCRGDWELTSSGPGAG